MSTAAIAEIVWSKYQEALYAEIESAQRRSLIVEAVAGSGKTSTLVECARRLDDYENAAAIAFNTRIKDELVKRLPPTVPAKTLNSHGYAAWRSFTGKGAEVDPSKVTKLVSQMSDDRNPEFKKGVKRLVDLAKMAGVADEGGLLPNTLDVWESLIDEYNVTFGHGAREKDAVSLAWRVLQQSNAQAHTSIDFNDQLYLPVIHNADFPQYDTLFVDEAQDLSEIQRVICERSVSKRGRLIAFGDPSQGIYGWRGAGKDSMGELKKRFDAVSLPLSISYRCSKAVVRHAQQFVPQIEFADNAPEGKVETLSVWKPEQFVSTDVILCRNNAPLVKLAFKLIRSGAPCKVLGRDLASGLTGLVQRFRAFTCAELTEKLNKYVASETAKLKEHPAQVTALLDKTDTLRIFIENASSPADVITKIESLFSDDNERYLTLSSAHKAKGCEWDRVFILDAHLIGARGMMQEEKNIHYVSITRAKKELYYITS